MVTIHNVIANRYGTTTVVLRNDNKFIKIEGIGLWDEEAIVEGFGLENYWEECAEYADAGEEGYTYIEL